MEYILVKDRQQVILGPLPWKARFIQSELNDLVEAEEKATAFTISQTEDGYVDCLDGYELIPVTFAFDGYDPIYQHLEGPLYTYDGNIAIGTYNVHETDIGLVKPALKNIAKTERQRKQKLSTTVTINGNEYTIATDDVELQKYVSAKLSIGDGTISWKFGTSFETVDATGLQSVIDAIRSYVQAQFDWEKSIGESIDAATDVETLKAIVIVEPTQTRGLFI